MSCARRVASCDLNDESGAHDEPDAIHAPHNSDAENKLLQEYHEAKALEQLHAGEAKALKGFNSLINVVNPQEGESVFDQLSALGSASCSHDGFAMNAVADARGGDATPPKWLRDVTASGQHPFGAGPKDVDASFVDETRARLNDVARGVAATELLHNMDPNAGGGSMGEGLTRNLLAGSVGGASGLVHDAGGRLAGSADALAHGLTAKIDGASGQLGTSAARGLTSSLVDRVEAKLAHAQRGLASETVGPIGGVSAHRADVDSAILHDLDAMKAAKVASESEAALESFKDNDRDMYNELKDSIESLHKHIGEVDEDSKSRTNDLISHVQKMNSSISSNLAQSERNINAMSEKNMGLVGQAQQGMMQALYNNQLQSAYNNHYQQGLHLQQVNSLLDSSNKAQNDRLDAIRAALKQDFTSQINETKNRINTYFANVGASGPTPMYKSAYNSQATRPHAPYTAQPPVNAAVAQDVVHLRKTLQREATAPCPTNALMNSVLGKCECMANHSMDESGQYCIPSKNPVAHTFVNVTSYDRGALNDNVQTPSIEKLDASIERCMQMCSDDTNCKALTHNSTSNACRMYGVKRPISLLVDTASKCAPRSGDVTMVKSQFVVVDAPKPIMSKCVNPTDPLRAIVGSLTVNESCHSDDSCASKACGTTGTGGTNCCRVQKDQAQRCFQQAIGDKCGGAATPNVGLSSADKMCASGFCSDGTCAAKPNKSANDVCASNAECESNACGKVDTAGETFCCTSGHKDDKGFCAQQTEGGKCGDGASVCGAGLICEESRKECIKNPNKTTNTACAQDDECESGHCALTGTSKTCCSTSSSHGWCDQQAVGGRCEASLSTGQCAKDLTCNNAECVKKFKADTSCVDGEECASGACGLTADNQRRCCAHHANAQGECDMQGFGNSCLHDANCDKGMFCDPTSKTCKANLFPNSTCSAPTQCEYKKCGYTSHMIKTCCTKDATLTADGWCTNQADGGMCGGDDANAKCKSKHCDLLTVASAGMGSHGVCTKMPVTHAGSYCKADQECGKNLYCDLESNRCVVKKADDAVCFRDAECKTACGHTKTGESTCCTDGKDSHGWCEKQAAGARCGGDTPNAQCESGYCKLVSKGLHNSGVGQWGHCDTNPKEIAEIKERYCPVSERFRQNSCHNERMFWHFDDWHLYRTFQADEAQCELTCSRDKHCDAFLNSSDTRCHLWKASTNSKSEVACTAGPGRGWWGNIKQRVHKGVVDMDKVKQIIPIGSFKDEPNRALRHRPLGGNRHSIEQCSNACASYQYFALQDGGQCFCDNDLKHATQYGPRECNSGGAAWCNYIFKHGEGIPMTPNYMGIGSFSDRAKRAMRYGPHRWGFTPESCREACSSYKYFALQDGNGKPTGWCSCDNDLQSVVQYGEHKDCSPSGGPWCNQVYLNTHYEDRTQPPTEPGCYVLMPSGCPRHPGRTRDWTARENQWVKDQSWMPRSQHDKHYCEVQRKKDYNGWCGVRDVRTHFNAPPRPPTPTAPGCHVLMPSGCPHHPGRTRNWTARTNEWVKDQPWVPRSQHDKHYCEVQRKKDYNGWCGVRDVRTHFNAEENMIDMFIDAIEDSEKKQIVPIGGFKDEHHRALRHRPIGGKRHSIEQCSHACASYKYFALQDGGQCFCDNDLKHATQYGPRECGKSGGRWCNYIYKHDHGIEVTPNYVGIGSFNDAENRAMRYGPKRFGFTPESCREACTNYKYFGLQDGHGNPTGQCFCDNDLHHSVQYGERNDCGRTGAAWCNHVYMNKHHAH